jgi:hypothetical protein
MPPASSTSSSPLRLGWYHLLMEIPAHWEVIAYKANARDGQLVLADRHGQCARVFWKTRQTGAGLDRRLVQAVRAQGDAAPSESRIRSRIREIGGWQAYLEPVGRVHALACRYNAETDALLYAAFPVHPDTRDPAVVARALASFRPNGGAERVWAGFGIDVTLPAALDLVRVRAFPAAQELRFENRRGESVTVHRYGMLSLLLADDDLETAFARLAGGKRLLYRRGTFTQSGRHPGVALAYTTRGKGGLEGFMARTWQGRVWVWRCDELQRLYAVDNNAREQNLVKDLAERVACR